MSENIYLPVSLGEAIDKLTILDIKIDNIKDDRKIDVKVEYDLLFEKLKYFIDKYNDLYKSMKKINLIIWKQMDILRDDNITNDIYIKICKECIDMNDIRFRIKNKINLISKSLLKEQKGYKINRLIIEINNEINNILPFFEPIKYYSFIYDEIIIYSNNKELEIYFKYDPTIIFEEDNKHKNNIKTYSFLENNYEKIKIYELFELNENIINMIL
jgi:hypothetical protein